MSEVKLVGEKRDYDKYLKIDSGLFEETAEDGTKVTYERFKLVRPDAVAIVVYNEDTDEVVLINQHRYPIEDREERNILELVAGKIDGDEEPKSAAIREIKEEIGFEIKEGKIAEVNSFYSSPGYSSEKVYLFLAFVKNEDKVSEGGGVEDEHENIDIELYKASEFFNMTANGEIVDAKAIIGAQALWHLRNSEIVEAGRRFVQNQRNEANQAKDAE